MLSERIRASKRNFKTMESSSDTPQPVLLNSSLSLPKNISKICSRGCSDLGSIHSLIKSL
ncbi:hypothetical protein CR513_36439, partial [Mucuna pruriens]